jgi:hypothetical protein
MESFRTEGATVNIRPDGILHIHYDDVFLKIEDTKRIFGFVRRNCPWEKSPVYLTGGSFTSQDPASRKFNGSEEVTKHCSAIAMLSTSMAQKILANFFMRIIKPAVPTKSFSTEEEAIEWLKNFETVELVK